jgi:signal transduction histidine kinase
MLEVTRPPVAHDAAGNPRAFAVPLVSRGKPLGVLTFVASARVPPWTDAERRLLEELAGRCGQALDNARLYGEAHAAIAKRDEFVAIASHELRTPLTTIELQLHLIQRRTAALCRDEAACAWLSERLRALYLQTENLNRLVHELLDVSRIMQRRLTIDLQPVDLSEVVREVIAALADRGAIARAGSEVEVSAPKPVRGRWDRMRVEQIVTNLVTNALKYGAGKPVDVEVRVTQEMASLVVRDHGIGIEPQDRARIFERFERAVPQHNYGGLGVGLYIVRQLVEELGGAVHVDSVRGEGSTFTVTLPLAGPPARRGRSSYGNRAERAAQRHG